MDYPYIKKYLGKEWLENQLDLVNSGEWIDEGIPKKKVIWMGHYTIKIIDQLIGKHKDVEGFQKWAKESKTSKVFGDCLFELICFDELLKSNKLIIKSKNINKIPDAFLKDEKIYVEMTNLKDIPLSIELKVNDLCEKSQERFENSLGIHFIGVNNFFEYNEKLDKLIPKKELSILANDLRKKLVKLNKNVLGFILVHNYLASHPRINKFVLYREIPFVIFNGVVDWDLLKKIVGDFKII